jgi:predicted ATPase/DNA-binding SARP family transcriptional activator/tetratricopeptide (TPR) repeat protein
VEFRILGSVEVADGGLVRDLGGLRERTLLARLLLSAGQVVSADRLAEDLWAGQPPAHWMSTLRVYISRLRRALGEGSAAVATQPPGYRITLGESELDAGTFARLVATAREDLTGGRPEAAAAGLREALSLWRGPALSDVADFAFAQADVARLEEARLAAVEDRVEADLACGRHASLVSELDGLVAAHPLRERLCGQRMLALYRCGRQADALQAYQDLRTRLDDELGIDPSPAVQRLQQEILRQEPGLDWRPPAAERTAGAARPAGPELDAPTSGGVASGRGRPRPPAAAEGPVPVRLPAETTSFIGRESELATIHELLGLSRLLTLTGPSGSGKTRLALKAGGQGSGRYPDGVWLVELAPVTGPDLVTAVVASALGAREEPGRPLADTIAAHLRDSEALVIIDNCEHVLDAAADLVTGLLRRCPSLRILATSQSRLNVAGEATWPVPPLTVPPPAEEDPLVIAEAESVRLFCDRAGLARPGFSLDAGNAAAVREICRRLDGIPLALELAAARLNALTARQLAARLDDRFRVLSGGSRTGLPRHRTLQAAIEWSYDLLSDAEQVAFRRLAVFAGGATLEAAEAVLPDLIAELAPWRGVEGGSPPLGTTLPADAVFETVSALVDRSLLTTEERDGSMRYGMLESVHHFARERLAGAGEQDELSRRHLDWLVDYADQADLDGPDQGAWMDLLETDMENVRAGLEWGLAQPGSEHALALAGSLATFWMVRGHAGIGRRWLDSALAAAGPQASPRLRAIALDGVGQLAYVQSDHDAQLGYQRESLSIWRELGDDVRTASCLGDLGAAAHIRGEYPAAEQMYGEALELARRAGASNIMARCLSGLGRLALHTDDQERATAYYTESMARFREAGDLRRATLILGNLGVVAFNEGDFDLAVSRLEEHLTNARKIGDRKLIGGALTNLGTIWQNTGDNDRAEQLHAEALALAEQVGDRRLACVALTNLGLVALARKDYERARSYHARSLELAEAVGERRSIAESLEELAGVDAAAGLMERAAVLFGASQAAREAIGAPILGPDLARFQKVVAEVRLALGEGAFTEAERRGRAMSEAEAVALARSDPPADATRDS